MPKKGGGRGDDHAKIIDLGLAEAHAAGRDDAEVLVQGTVPYMSPEVHRARRQPVRTDLFKVDAWAMGCVLWATAAGLDPWREMVPDDDGGGGRRGRDRDGINEVGAATVLVRSYTRLAAQ